MARTKTQTEPAMPRIFTVRRQKVVLDADLAKLYGVPTKRLNEAVRRSSKRFPPEFSFVINKEEFANLMSQIAVSSVSSRGPLRSQTATLDARGSDMGSPRVSGRGRHRKYLPRVFTEHGALMAANVLRSERAVEMSLYLIRAFIQMREALLANATILKRLAEIDRRLVEHDSVLREVIDRLQPLLDAPDDDSESKPKIGYHQGNR